MNQEKRMPPKLSDEIKKLNLILPSELCKRIDAWRGRQPGVPNRSEAIRSLLEMSLNTADASHDRPKPKKSR